MVDGPPDVRNGREECIVVVMLTIKILALATLLLKPAHVFDGTAMHDGWVVLVRGDRIAAVGPASQVGAPADATVIDLPGMTLMPGMIEGHSHLFLHPYNETPWDVQVLKEPLALRTARAVNQARATLMAGFTSERDLGTEGAGDADVGLKMAIDQGIIPGPRLIVVTRAIVATGSYGPKGFDPRWDVPQGAQQADGIEGVTHAVREQIGKGADWIKVYADYRWGPNGETRPTFTQEELTQIVLVARSSGRPVAAHASSAEAVKRAVLAGVETVEHADGGTAETFALMAQKGVALCPTLAADDAIARYRGWKAGVDSEPRDDHCETRELQARARRRRHDLHGRRRGRLHARRERARDGIDGRVGHVTARRAPLGHIGERQSVPHR